MEQKELHNENDTFLAKWLAGELSDAELKTLVSETDYNSFLKIRKGIEAYDQLEGSTSATYAQIQEKIASKKEKVRKLNTNYWLLGIAASVILFFGILTFLKNDIVSIETNFGEQKTIALLDGSEVIINSKSTLIYDEDEWESNRRLSLEGEAYFKVKKGSTFTVVTKNGQVQVLGTEFNVRTVDDLFEVICFEGKVSVETNDESFFLTPTKSVRRINGFEIEQWDVIEANPSWIHGESNFKSVPLRYVISALESQYNIQIHSNSIDENLVYTGSFTHKNLNTALITVFKSLQIQYFEKEKGHIYLSIK